MNKLKSLVATFLVAPLFLQSQVAFARCTVNGKEIPCDIFWKEYGWIFGLIGTVLLVIFSVFFGFWIWMLINCLKSTRKDKFVWTLVLLFGNIIGAVLYFFIAKDKTDEISMG